MVTLDVIDRFYSKVIFCNLLGFCMGKCDKDGFFGSICIANFMYRLSLPCDHVHNCSNAKYMFQDQLSGERFQDR